MDGRYDLSVRSFISIEETERLSRYKAQIGDIILGRKGEVGRAMYISEDYHGFLIGSDIIPRTIPTRSKPPSA